MKEFCTESDKNKYLKKYCVENFIETTGVYKN